MFHLVAYDSSIANGSVFLQVNAVAPDPFSNPQNNNYVIGDLQYIVGASHYGADAQRAQLRSPTLVQVFNADIVPVRKAALAANVFPNWFDLSDSPLKLKNSEQLSIYAIQGNAGAQREYIAVLLADGPLKPVSGNFWTVRFTGTTTLVADAWTTCVMTAEQNLQVGTYTVVGARCKTATGVYFRVGTQGYPWRPGGAVGSDDAFPDPPNQRLGGWGQWFTFKNTQTIALDVLATAGDTAETLELDVMFTPG